MQKKPLVLLFLILITGAFFRFYKITEIPPGLYPDEAVNGTNAQEAIQTGEYKLFYPENNGREGLFMNIQSLSLRAFGKKPWALRVVSAIFGTLTVLGIYLLAKELFVGSPTSDMMPDRVGLISAFLLATSFWHINFSRIGFRAITLPFFLTFGFYFLYRMLRSLREDGPKNIKTELYAVLGGIFYGLGFYGYIAYRVTPLLLIVPFLSGWRDWRAGMGSKLGNLVSNWKLSFQVEEKAGSGGSKCFPCLFLLFLFAAFVAALPIGYYFLTHPADFSGRTAEVSILGSANPARALGLNVIKTIGMFFVVGDYNWRHNLSGAPELWWPISILLALGLFASTKRIPIAISYKLSAISLIKTLASAEFLLLWWLAVLSIPVIISAEGLPHALRAIGMVIPTMILAALGLDWLMVRFKEMHVRWFERYQGSGSPTSLWKSDFPKWLSFSVVGFCIALAAHTFNQYFYDWALNPRVASAFSERYTRIGELLATLPREKQKYVIVNASGVLVRGVPMPAQPVMFALGDGIATRAQATSSNVRYLLPEDVPLLAGPLRPNPGSVIVLLEEDAKLWEQIRVLLPTLTITVNQDGILLGNL